MNPAELDQLADLVAARLEARQRADTYAPTLLTIGPNGEIQADFTGHVRARGFDLVAGEAATRVPGSVAAAPDEMAWHLTDFDGAILLKLFGVHGPGAYRRLFIGARDGAGNEDDYNLLGYDGSAFVSQLVRLISDDNLRLMLAITATTGVIQDSNGITSCNRAGVGLYDYVFPQTFADPQPFVLTTALPTAGSVFAHAASLTRTGVRIVTRTSTTGAAVDCAHIVGVIG